ncbi:MAG TPA: hypothetical protein VGH28_03705 [Polyangiaceae bacterium]
MKIRVAGFSLVLLAAPASASEPGNSWQGEITSDTATQFYDVLGPTGTPVLIRARLTSTLGVSVYDLLPRPETAGQELLPDLTFRARMRYDADYGAAPEEATPANVDRFVPGFSRGPVDLMYAYVEGRRFVHGLVGFKVGRQYVTDALGWWSFDGGMVRVTTPAYFALEAYGGLEVRGGLPFSGSLGRWEADGVWRGDRSGLDPSQYPSFQQDDVAPAIGVAVETAGLSWLHARLTYRRVYNTNDSIVTQFANGDLAPVVYSGTRVSQEKLGYGLEASAPKVGGVSGGVVYDFYANLTSNIWATADVFITKKITASLDYDYFQPTYDADSIWNFFATYPMNDLGAHLLWNATQKLSFAAGAHVRAFQNQTQADGSPQSALTGNDPIVPGVPQFTFNGGGTLSARFRRRDTLVEANASGNFGDEGDRVGADVHGERVLDARYVLTTRLGLWHWEDKLRPERSALSFGAVAGAGYRFFHGSQMGVEWENDINALVGWRMRVLAYLRLAVTK